jgi:hypothetical protein
LQRLTQIAPRRCLDFDLGNRWHAAPFSPHRGDAANSSKVLAYGESQAAPRKISTSRRTQRQLYTCTGNVGGHTMLIRSALAEIPLAAYAMARRLLPNCDDLCADVSGQRSRNSA